MYVIITCCSSIIRKKNVMVPTPSGSRRIEARAASPELSHASARWGASVASALSGTSFRVWARKSRKAEERNRNLHWRRGQAGGD